MMTIGITMMKNIIINEALAGVHLAGVCVK
jgi:hypothetical protein